MSSANLFRQIFSARSVKRQWLDMSGILFRKEYCAFASGVV